MVICIIYINIRRPCERDIACVRIIPIYRVVLVVVAFSESITVRVNDFTESKVRSGSAGEVVRSRNSLPLKSVESFGLYAPKFTTYDNPPTGSTKLSDGQSNCETLTRVPYTGVLPASGLFQSCHKSMRPISPKILITQLTFLGFGSAVEGGLAKLSTPGIRFLVRP